MKKLIFFLLAINFINYAKYTRLEAIEPHKRSE